MNVPVGCTCGAPISNTRCEAHDKPKGKAPKFFVKLTDGAYLHRFDMGWYTHHQDDPSCWTDKRDGAKAYTAAQIAKMEPFIRGFQGEFTIEAVQS